ncbi:hypothetical protein [Endozoicomonas ascidiicola]|uniref:hypothetical protein n=1 Tax=Endozoicomonas ascidiicola TaxID=1698521 RepID=UPI0008366F73|nr:hypothetical protein [Endozoicomonas ascidiicola]
MAIDPKNAGGVHSSQRAHEELITQEPSKQPAHQKPVSNFIPPAEHDIEGTGLHERLVENQSNSPEALENLLRTEKDYLATLEEKSDLLKSLERIKPLVGDLDSLKNNLSRLNKDFGFSISYQYEGINGEDVSIIPPDSKLSEEELFRLLGELGIQIKKMDDAFKDEKLTALSEKIKNDINNTTTELLELKPESEEITYKPKSKEVIDINPYLPDYPTRSNLEMRAPNASDNNSGGHFKLYNLNKQQHKPSDREATPPSSLTTSPKTPKTLPHPSPSPVLRDSTGTDDTIPKEIPASTVPSFVTSPRATALSDDFSREQADIIFAKNKVDFQDIKHELPNNPESIGSIKSIALVTPDCENESDYFAGQIHSQFNEGSSTELLQEFHDILFNKTKLKREKKTTLDKYDVLEIVHKAFASSRLSLESNSKEHFNIYLMLDNKNYLINRGDIELCCIPNYFPDEVKNIHIGNTDPEIQSILRQKTFCQQLKEPNLLPAITELPDDDDTEDKDKRTHYYCFQKNRNSQVLNDTSPLSDHVIEAKSDDDITPATISEGLVSIIEELNREESVSNKPLVLFNFSNIDPTHDEGFRTPRSSSSSDDDFSSDDDTAYRTPAASSDDSESDLSDYSESENSSVNNSFSSGSSELSSEAYSTSQSGKKRRKTKRQRDQTYQKPRALSAAEDSDDQLVSLTTHLAPIKAAKVSQTKPASLADKNHTEDEDVVENDSRYPADEGLPTTFPPPLYNENSTSTFDNWFNVEDENDWKTRVSNRIRSPRPNQAPASDRKTLKEHQEELLNAEMELSEDELPETALKRQRNLAFRNKINEITEENTLPNKDVGRTVEDIKEPDTTLSSSTSPDDSLLSSYDDKTSDASYDANNVNQFEDDD